MKDQYKTIVLLIIPSSSCKLTGQKSLRTDPILNTGSGVPVLTIV